MSRNTDNRTSRRDFLRLAAGSAAFGPFFLFPQGTLASQKTLKIAKWAHFLPEFDVWFQNVLANEWGNKHDTKIIVDDIPVEQVMRAHRLRSRPAKAMMFLSFHGRPPSTSST